MKSVNIFAISNGVGISRDITIVSEVLKSAGFEVGISPMYQYKPRRKYDLNIFLERFNPEWFDTSPVNVMIPNQEWFEDGWHKFIPAFDCFFVKTHFAEQIFQKLGASTQFISFTSDDRYLPDVKKDDQHWLHIVGKSVQKQTETVLKTWAKNPGFPNLTVIQDPKFYKPRAILRNVTYMYDRLPESTLKHLQNNYAFHLCPSDTEGFGHYIMEALSCRAVVITTNAPPMNEIVTPDRGLYVEPVRTEKMRLSTRFITDEKFLEDAVAKVLTTDEKKRKELGENGRQFYLDNDRMFRKQLVDAVNAVI